MFARIDVQEHNEKEKLNQNPGGEELMAKAGGAKTGLPFFAFLDSKGQSIVNSLRPVEGKAPTNIGHPMEPEEVDWFMVMVKKAAPAMSADDARTVETWLREQRKRAAEAISKELADLYKADQGDRENWAKMSHDEQMAVTPRDAQRRKRVMEMVRASQLAAAEDYYNAAMVLQHGDKPEDFLLAHELATVAAFKGQAGAKWLSAAALDRFLHNIGRPQHFGTQYKYEGDSPWTQDPYDRSLPDAVRKEFGVPPMREQKKQLEELNKQRSRQ